MHKTLLITSLLLLLGVQALFAQTKVITGKVIGSDGQPIPGASVVIKGTSTGVITDVDGNYSLQVPNEATAIQISYLGMKSQDFVIGTTNSINASLQDDSININEVVVTAFGIKRDKKALGYATQEVKAAELTRGGNSDIATALQGKIAGVDIKPSSGMPGASAQFVIRGARSFTGNNSPLYVVDGMPIASTSDFESGGEKGVSGAGDGITGSDIAGRSLDIDPNEIESINILKGQAAAAQYGIKASNGVVIITTKSGKGLPVGKPVVTLSNNTSFETISRYPDLQKRYAQGYYGDFNPSTSMSWGPKVEDIPNSTVYGGNVPNELNGFNTTKYQGRYYVPQLADAGLDPWVTPQIHDNAKDFFKTGHTISTSANVSQNLENSNYSLGIGSTNQQGIIPSTSMNRYNARFLAEATLGKGWKSGVSANFTTSNINKASGGNDAVLGAVLPAPINYDLANIPYHLPTDPYSQINYRSLTFDNPYWAIENNLFNEKSDRFFGNAFLEFAPKINWGNHEKLSFRYQFGGDSYTTHYQDIFEFGSTGGLGKIDNYGVTNMNINSLFTANYSMNFFDNLEFVTLVGNEITQDNAKKYDQFGQNFNFGDWKNISNTNVLTSYETQRQKRTVGFFASASLNYKSLLFLNATGRNDVVSTMPRNNRSFFYPSVSLGFVFTEFDALKDNGFLSFGKIRTSYAQVGQAGDYYNDYYKKPNYGGGFWGGKPVSYPLGGVSSYIPNSTIYDPALTPQNTKSYEVGADLRFLNNRIAVEYTYSRQDVTKQIFNVPLAGSSGAAERVMNGGKIHTNSHEIILGIKVIDSKSLRWNIGVNHSKTDTYVDELAPGVESIYLGGFTTPQVRAGIGSTFPVIYGTTFKRDAQGRILVNEDPTSDYYGMPMAGELGVIANCAPNFLMGANTDVTYKNITLSATFSWQNGGQMYSGTNGLFNLYGMSKETEDRTTPFVYDGYLANGQKNNIQRGGATDANAYQALYSDVLGNIDEAYIYDMDFVKLREVTLSYRLPRFYGVNASISAYVRNILLWTKLPNLDPESSQGNNNMGGYFERFSMPQTSSYGMGINITF